MYEERSHFNSNFEPNVTILNNARAQVSLSSVSRVFRFRFVVSETKMLSSMQPTIFKCLTNEAVKQSEICEELTLQFDETTLSKAVFLVIGITTGIN